MPVSDSTVRGTHTLGEILSQPDVWLSCLRDLANDPALQSVRERAKTRTEWIFVGCGTSFYLAEAAAASWTLLTGQPARAFPASELLLFPQLVRLHGNLQAVIISRSGRTSEALRAAEILAQSDGVATLGVTCAANSELAKACQATIVLRDADEKSMVMTRSFTSMLLALLQLADSVAESQDFRSAMERIAAAFSRHVQSFNNRLQGFTSKHAFEDYIYLAQGPFFPIAREAALKITEMSCSYAQAYHTLEFRHGPKSIVAPQTLVTFFLSETGMEAESEVLVEMKELGATTMAVCNRANEIVRRSSDLLLELDVSVPEVALLAPFTVPAQLLGLHTGIKKGFNPDEPKNLSRVVILD